MRENDLIRLKRISALRLLGVSNENIALLTGDSEATIKRYNMRLCKMMQLDNAIDQVQLKNKLEDAKQQVKGTKFQKKKELSDVKKQLKIILSTNIDKYISIIWFGNIMKTEEAEPESIAIENRFITPKQSAKFGFSGVEKKERRLKNLGFVMSLMGMPHETVDLNLNQIEGYNNHTRVQFHDYKVMPDESDDSHDLIVIAPRVPANCKQKEKKLLIEFALKHLGRSDSNFIYAECFNKKELEATTAEFEDLNKHTIRVFAPNDILDWFECYEESIKKN